VADEPGSAVEALGLALLWRQSRAQISARERDDEIFRARAALMQRMPREQLRAGACNAQLRYQMKGRKSRFECTASNGVNKRQRRVQLERCKNKSLQVRARKRSKSRKAA